MAEGGALDLTELANIAENIQAQNDEITVLQSIFEGEKERLEILESPQDVDNGEIQAQNMLKIYIPVKCGEKLHVDVQLPAEMVSVNGLSSPGGLQLARSESGRRILYSFEVSHLPPMCVHVTLPVSYPEKDPPSFVVSCVWLSPQQLTVVCKEFDRLWSECKGDTDSPGTPVLYTWLDWVQEHMLKCLSVEKQISVTCYTLDEDVDDCRVVVETDDLNNIVTQMVRYNRQEEQKVFNISKQVCSICFDENLGYKFFLLPDCRHHVCRDCLTNHCQLLVKEGAVLHIRCPMFECEAFIPPHVLKEVLSREDFERFDSLALQKGLETMGDITWCPRCNSAVIQEPEEGLNLAHCTTCFFTFCTLCMEKSHQGEKCKTELEMLERNGEIDATKKAQASAKREEQERKMRQRKQNKESHNYISQMARRCPNCKAPIMKIGGCNKVQCANCLHCMCFICERDITKEGYSHFTNQCNTFTFENDVIDNTDIADPIRMGVVRAQRLPPPPRQPTQGSEIEDRLRMNPELRKRMIYCFTCKQKNIKDSQSNHIRCWNCKNSSCYYCRKKIVGPVGKHYSGLNACPQHTYEPGLDNVELEH